MTITSTQRNEITDNLWTYYPCGELVKSYRSAAAMFKTIADNPKESRTYPVDPLNSLTAQAKQYTEERLVGISREGLYVSGYQSCNGVSTPIHQYKFRSFGPGLRIGTAPDTNWALDIRLAIQERYVNLGTNVAEFRQTAGMFKQFAEGARDAWKLFHGKLPKNRKHLTPCAVPAAELMLSYGVKPLADDLYNSVATLGEKLENPLIQRISVFSSERKTVNAKDSVSERVGYWLTSDRTTAYVEFVPDKGNFTLGNPLSLAWEVVPYSFVVDWAIPIGDYLSSLDALKDVKGLRGTRTRKEKYFHRYYDKLYTEIRPSLHKYKSHQRFVLTTIPLPRVPTWSPSKSWIAIRHGVSLLWQLRRCRD